MKKIILYLSLISTIGLTNSEYIIKIPIVSNNGGQLPDNSIIIKPKPIIENWVPTDPFVTEWINFGELIECSNWSPNESTINFGTQFTQIANDCVQEQRRTVQNQEIETNSGNIRYAGLPYNEVNLLTNQINNRFSTGTFTAPDCRFEWFTYQWLTNRVTGEQSIIWSDSEVSLWTNPGSVTSLDYLNYRYTKGSFNSAGEAGWDNYNICRTLI